jgi:hypothetical protein
MYFYLVQFRNRTSRIKKTNISFPVTVENSTKTATRHGVIKPQRERLAAAEKAKGELEGPKDGGA